MDACASTNKVTSGPALIEDVEDTCKTLRENNPHKQLVVFAMHVGAWLTLVADISVELAESPHRIISMQDQTESADIKVPIVMRIVYMLFSSSA